MKAEVRTVLPGRICARAGETDHDGPTRRSLLPTTPTGWYLHYHYIATGPKPYGETRLNESATDKSAYAQVVARVLPELRAPSSRLGLENITLVDPETLDVFFSI